MRQIAELRAQTEAADPEAAQREKELMAAIEVAKTEPRCANDEVEKQRKVREELLRFIGPGVSGMDFLRHLPVATELSAFPRK
jgi:hypothetical protein